MARYDEQLLRAISARLFKPRSQWPADELIDRCVESLRNAPVIDRRLKEIPASCRMLLVATARTRREDWTVGQLLALLATLGFSEGLDPILRLLDSGLVVPVLADGTKPLADWESWLGANPTGARLLIPSPIADRAGREPIELPQLPGKKFDAKFVHTSDGLEWPLRLGIVWQLLRAGSMRLTQSNTLFKRDLLRLQEDSLLTSHAPEPSGKLPDSGLLAIEFGIATGLFSIKDGELTAAQFPQNWSDDLPPMLGGIWSATSAVRQWDPVKGYQLTETPFSTVAVAAILLLSGQNNGTWTHPSDIAAFLIEKHPSWSATLDSREDAAEDWIEQLLLGWGVSTRIVEAAQDGEGWWFRLTAFGKATMSVEPVASGAATFSQCLVVQPNGDIVVYRQGLTPDLVAKLSRFADWKSIGPACTLGLSAESVYRGLESGLTISEIIGMIQQRSAHPVPANVVDLIRRWAGKRDRIAVYAAATLIEFTTDADLESAYVRGMVSRKLTDRIGLVEGDVDYTKLRLLGNRDYEAKPQKCITFAPDGVTFSVDVSTSDLMLEAELSRFAIPAPTTGHERKFQITPAIAAQARERGLTLDDVNQWCLDRSGAPMSASARLLFLGGEGKAAVIRRRIVVTFPSEILTEGICQWPPTGDLLEDRLGPYSVAVPEESLSAFLDQLSHVGVQAVVEADTVNIGAMADAGS